LYTLCVLGLRPSALFNEFLLIKKKKIYGWSKDKLNACSWNSKGVHAIFIDVSRIDSREFQCVKQL